MTAYNSEVFMETKISSMWDKIFECTIPINKISMIVAFSKGEEFVSPSGAGQKKQNIRQMALKPILTFLCLPQICL